MNPPLSQLEKIFNLRKGYFWVGLIVVIGLLSSTLIISFGQPVLAPAPALIWSIAYIVIGGLGGLMFGIPKTLTRAEKTSEITGSPQASREAASLARKQDLEENTNLYQVSDWLTKVIVGAGLVQMKEIPGFILKVAEKMSRGIVQPPYTMDAAVSLSSAIILYFTVYGFISGFLITRLMITDMLEGSENK